MNLIFCLEEFLRLHGWNLRCLMDILHFLHTVGNDKSLTGIPGLNDPQLRSFKHYFEGALTYRFGELTPALILRFAVLNFTCQQLAVRTVCAPSENAFVFFGFGRDLVASLMGMVPTLKAMWLRPSEDPWEAEHVTASLGQGEPDDIQDFVLCDQPHTATISSMPECSIGAAVFTDDMSVSSALIEEAVCRLSPGGLVLYSAANCVESNFPSNEFDLVSADQGPLSEAFRGGVSVVRRKW